jgi:putative ABC transport system permease protein
VLALMTAFAVLALTLAATGASAAIGCVTALRTKEYAIRMALGANRARVVGSVVGYGCVLAGIGLAIGLAAAMAASPALQNLPVTVRAPDLVTIGAVSLLVGAIAVMASAVPARRATAVDLIAMLRRD